MAATHSGADRKSRLQEIEEARMSALRAELQEGGQDPSVLDAPPELKNTEEALPQEQEESPQTGDDSPQTGVEAPPEEVPPEKPKVRLKVDGQEIEVDEDKIREEGIKALQKEIAADKRLEEASKLKKALEDEYARVQQQTQQPAQAVAAPQQPDDQFLAAVKKIQYGSEAEAGEALRSLIASAAQAGRPQELTMNQVQDFIEFREATKWAFDEFKDLLGDPVLRTAFAEAERAKRAAGDKRPYREVYQEIGGGLRGWLGQMTKAPQTPQTKIEKKAAVVQIPAAAARPQPPQQQKEPTASELIAQMRKDRKQG